MALIFARLEVDCWSALTEHRAKKSELFAYIKGNTYINANLHDAGI